MAQSDTEAGGSERCGECGRGGLELMSWGDRGEMPPVCRECYFNPGWYRDTDNDQ